VPLTSTPNKRSCCSKNIGSDGKCT
jgi:hypothetical protein